MLPSLPVSLFLNCFSAAIMVTIFSALRGAGALPVVLSLLATAISGIVVPALIRSSDNKTIASFRRFSALLFASNLIWIFPLVIGVVASPFVTGTVYREFVFGAFLAWGFQLVIINGAFVRRLSASIALAAIQPISLLLITTFGKVDPTAILPGVAALLVFILFLFTINRIRTRGIASLDMLRAFLRAWVANEPSGLEAQFMTYAEPRSVETGLVVMRAGEKPIAMVLPGVHPGPFSPVGSYDLSELLYAKLKEGGVTPIVLHGIGGHERNTPTNALASDYAEEVSKFVSAQKIAGPGLMRGPLHSMVGITSITTIGFGEQVLAIVTNAPYRSDDLDPETVTSAFEAAADLGLTILPVDAHNSVNGEMVPQKDISRNEWKSILSGIAGSREKQFSTGFAHSSEVGFQSKGDVSDGGISVLILASEDQKNVLISADSNNAVSGLRERLKTEVEERGMGLIDLCTSDTHKLAARNLTRRGYFALGESTNIDDIVALVAKLLALADSRLQPGAAQVFELESRIPLIGTESLDNFASITKEAISFSKRFLRVGIPALLVLLTISLFY